MSVRLSVGRVGWLVGSPGQSVGRSFHNFLKGWEVTLPSSYGALVQFITPTHLKIVELKQGMHQNKR